MFITCTPGPNQYRHLRLATGHFRVGRSWVACEALGAVIRFNCKCPVDAVRAGTEDRRTSVAIHTRGEGNGRNDTPMIPSSTLLLRCSEDRWG